MKIRIKENSKEYGIFVGYSIIDKIIDFVAINHNNKRVVVISDKTVKKLYGNKISQKIAVLNPSIIYVTAGEQSKSRSIKEQIENFLFQNKFGRDTLIIALGGGVIGDLVGFVASTFNRGVPLIQMPTTLLAMVDSSIGGKAAINTEHGKNLIGTMYHPDAVFVDLDFLETLPEEEFLNGLAEIIKISIIKDTKLFNFLKNNHKKILQRDKETLMHIIKRSIGLKKHVVEKDPEESGLRQILNFGHTFGHALETYHKYKIKHGYAVTQGIIVESKISELTGNLNGESRREIIRLLGLFKFPLTVNLDVAADEILELMAADKKTRNLKPRFVLIKRIGEVKSVKNNFSFAVNEQIIKKSIEICKND